MQKDLETPGNPDGITLDPKPTVEAPLPPQSKTEQFHDDTQQKEEIMQQSQDQDAVNNQRPPNPRDADPEVEAKTRSNRENAQKSTGPRTNTGRAASSRNAVKHGLFAADITQYFRTEEESQRYQRFIDGIVKDIAPVGDFEDVLARRAADIQFRLEVLRTAEFKVYAGAGLVKDTVEGLLDKSGDPMGLASLYDSRFQRAFSKTMEDLRRAQQSRRDKELHALEQLKGIALAHIQGNATFDPAKFGFFRKLNMALVFSMASSEN